MELVTDYKELRSNYHVVEKKGGHKDPEEGGRLLGFSPGPLGLQVDQTSQS